VDGIVSLHVLSEFIEVLTRARFGVERATAIGLAEEIARFAEVVPLAVASGSWVVDRDDDPVVEAALAGRATHLVTGDVQIHKAAVEHVEVISPADAARLVENLRDS
jgi:predicted nucleic acid-binding protein